MKYIGVVILVMLATTSAWAVTPVTKYVSESGNEFDTAAEARHDDELQPIIRKLYKEYEPDATYIDGVYVSMRPHDDRRVTDYAQEVAEFILKYYPPEMNCNSCHKGVTK